MQQNMQSRQQFNQSMNQRTQDFQQRQLQKNRSGSVSPQMAREEQMKAQAKQEHLEQEANEKLASLAQEQEQQRQAHPAKNPQQAAAQLKADARQLNQLAVKNYREVFLPGQVHTALVAQQLSPRAEQSLQNLNQLLDDKWWSKQDGAQLPGKMKAYSDSLTALTTSLFGFAPTAPPAMPAPFSMSSLDALLAKDAFDQDAASQLIRQAALAEQLEANGQLSKAVNDFTLLSASVDSDPTLQADPKKLRREIQKSLRTVNKEMGRYRLSLASATKVYTAEKALRKSTTAYLAKKTK